MNTQIGTQLLCVQIVIAEFMTAKLSSTENTSQHLGGGYCIIGLSMVTLRKNFGSDDFDK
jgi:hypothetical protein